MRLCKREQGSILLEVIVAIGLIAAAVVGAMTVLANHSIATRSADAGDVAINLVRTQLEDIKDMPYSTNATPCYSRTVLYPSTEYTVTITVVLEQPPNLQRVTVTANRGGKTYLSIETYKANLGGTVSAAACTS